MVSRNLWCSVGLAPLLSVPGAAQPAATTPVNAPPPVQCRAREAPLAGEVGPARPVSPDKVERFTLGGTGEERERRFALQLQPADSMIVDLIPVNTASAPAEPRPRRFIRRDRRREQGETSSGIQLQVVSPGGQVTKPASSDLEATLGDSAQRVALYAEENGEYRIVVRNEADALSPFELLVRPRAVEKPAPIQGVQFGASTAGSLPERGQRLYSFYSDRPGWATIEMKSEKLDSLVEIFQGSDADGEALDSDDDGGEGQDAQLFAKLPAAGCYTIAARSLSSEAGDFSLALARYDPPRLSPRPMGLGVTPGSFSGADHGISTGQYSGGYHLYQLAGKAGQQFVIDMHSDEDELDPWLEAGVEVPAADASSTSSDGFAVVASDDDGGDGLDAKLRIVFTKAATLQFRVGGGRARPRGAYTIKVTEEQSPAR